MRTPTPRERARALAFSSCEQCTYDFVSHEGERSCSYGTCPYLPELLDPRCPTCLLDFYTGEGVPGCGEEPACQFALEEAAVRVEILTEWRRRRDLAEAML